MAWRRVPDGVALEVSNRGRPIPAERLPGLFDGAWQHRTRDGAGGTGLGLFIARAIVAAHGGRIAARSDERETVFTVHLPGAAEPAPPPGSAERPPP